MPLVRSVFSLRKKEHLFTRFELRDERAYCYRLLPWLALVDIAFGFVDWVSVPASSPLEYFGLRAAGVIISAALWYLLRGRVRYGLRVFLVLAPYVFTVEYIMISNGLIMSPYFAGVGLVMFTSTMLFPLRFRIAAAIYGTCVLPVIAYPLIAGVFQLHQVLQQVLMAAGSAIVCALNSGHIWVEFRSKLVLSETLARDKGRRGKVIQEKANEIVRRKIFESQFSPQVVTALLKNRSSVREMVRTKIANIVIDIQDSTKKAHSLDPEKYKQVIEEVLDVFSAACLKWNVTLDKFIGDGVQAFAGAPFSDGQDLRRAIMACRDSMLMLQGRKNSLELLWNGELNVRFAVCQGEALIGFVGKGVFKSYTAIGDMISFTHRLSAIPAPWTIAAFVWDDRTGAEIAVPGFETARRSVSNLKGFGERIFTVTVLTPIAEDVVADAGRCQDCETPLVLEEGPHGLPRIFCPACSARADAAA